jgi:hypothetical protein
MAKAKKETTSRIVKLAERRNELSDDIRKLKLEDALEHAPNFVKFLREKYGSHISRGEISAYNLSNGAYEEKVQILYDKELIGEYTRTFGKNGESQVYDGSLPVRLLSVGFGTRSDKEKHIPFP